VTTLRFGRKQDVDKLFVKVQTSENAKVRASGTVRVGNASKTYRFKSVTRSLPGGASVKLRLRLPKKALKAVKRSIAKHARPRAKITVTATDAAGNRRTKKAAVRLTR
jgi:hypothetical protein